MFRTKVVEKIETHLTFKNLLPKNVFLWDITEYFGTAGQARDGNTTWRIRFACRVPKVTNTHTHTHTHTQNT